jgi:RecA/RadA recombinase
VTPPEPRAHAKVVSAKAMTLADRIRSLKPVRRLPTQFETLNKLTRGGLPMRSLSIFGGAPGAGKTTLAMNIAMELAAAGAPVTWLAVDEDFDDLLIRLGQAEGVGRDEMEAAEPGTLAKIADRIGDAYPALSILDGDDVFVEDAAAELLGRRPGDDPALLVLDSLQTVRARASEGIGDPRLRVDAVVAAARKAAKSGLAVIATSELNRGGYRSKNPSERTEGIAAFKETGGIEYRCKLGLILRKVAGVDGLREVEIPKNRIGRDDVPPLRLLLDRQLAVFRETDLASDAVAPGLDSANQLEVDITAAREALRKNPGVAGYDRLRAALTGMSGKRRNDAVRALKAGGEILNRGTVNQPRLYLNDEALPGLTGLTVRGVTAPITPLLPPLGVRALGKAPGQASTDDEPVRPPGAFDGSDDGGAA